MNEPKPKYCPYCGKSGIYKQHGMMRCDSCRFKFMIDYWRQLKALVKR